MEENRFGAMLPEMRLDFWDALWAGQISSAAALGRRLSVLELPLEPDCACCRCVLRLQYGDAYLRDVWRYGRDRLRVAVGNLLPKAESGIIYGVCRLTTRHIYILACAQGTLAGEALEKRVREDIEKLITCLDQYLNLSSELKEITAPQPLSDIATEQKRTQTKEEAGTDA